MATKNISIEVDHQYDEEYFQYASPIMRQLRTQVRQIAEVAREERQEESEYLKKVIGFMHYVGAAILLVAESIKEEEEEKSLPPYDSERESESEGDDQDSIPNMVNYLSETRNMGVVDPQLGFTAMPDVSDEARRVLAMAARLQRERQS